MIPAFATVLSTLNIVGELAITLVYTSYVYVDFCEVQPSKNVELIIGGFSSIYSNALVASTVSLSVVASPQVLLLRSNVLLSH